MIRGTSESAKVGRGGQHRHTRDLLTARETRRAWLSNQWLIGLKDATITP